MDPTRLGSNEIAGYPTCQGRTVWLNCHNSAEPKARSHAECRVQDVMQKAGCRLQDVMQNAMRHEESNAS